VASNQSCRRIALWRTIMKSPYTRTAAVVAIGLAVLSFLFPTRNGIIPASVALAEVQAAVDAQQTVFVGGTRTLIFHRKPTFLPPAYEKLFDGAEGEDGSFIVELTAETYMSPEGYATKICDRKGQLQADIRIHFETGMATLLLPASKAYARFELLPVYRDKIAGFTLQGLIKMIYESDKSRKIGPERVQGIDAVGFEVTVRQEQVLEGFNPVIIGFLFNMQWATVRVWIDPQTRLPIRSESECDFGKCLLTLFEEVHTRQIDDAFQWGVEIDEAMFLPDIPEDYHELSLPSGAALGVAASSVALAGVAPWCVFFLRRSGRSRRSASHHVR
jgi:hypothetical protein